MNEKETEEKKLPKLHSGMRIEVLTPSNHLIFVGKAEVLSGNVLSVTEESGQNVPWVEYNTQVKLRGFQRDGIPFALYGYICGSTEKLWRIDRLETLQMQELRHFFRQTVTLQATVMCVNQIFAPKTGLKNEVTGAVPCKVVDISGGGVRVRCSKEARFQVGDWLFFSAENPLEEDMRMNYTCCVRRVSEEKNCYEYGCEFDGLTETEQEVLLRIVMAFQQRELRARRRAESS